MKKAILSSFYLLFASFVFAQKYPFSGLNMNMGNLYKLSDKKNRSISPPNFTIGKGKGEKADIKDEDQWNVANASRGARDLGQGWKVNSNIRI